MKNHLLPKHGTETHAIILAAGLGSRLKENTKAIPKCLVPVSGRPILERMLENLGEIGVARVTIVVGYLHNAIRDFVVNWRKTSPYSIEISFVLNDHFAQSGSVLSLEMALLAAEPDRDLCNLLLIEGDVVLDCELLQQLLKQGESSGHSATLLAPYEPALSGTFATVKEGIVSAWLHESVRTPLFNLEGTYKTVNLTFVPKGKPRAMLLSQVSSVIREEGVKAPLEYAMQNLVRHGMRINMVSTNEFPWFEVDTPEDLAIANSLFPSLTAST